MGLFATLFDKLKSKMTSETQVVVKHIEQEFDDLREDFKKEIARLEAKIAPVKEAAPTQATASGTSENPTSTATASTASPSTEVAAQNAEAAKSTL